MILECGFLEVSPEFFEGECLTIYGSNVVKVGGHVDTFSPEAFLHVLIKTRGAHHGSCTNVDGGKSSLYNSILLGSVGICEFECESHLIGSCNLLKLDVFSGIIRQMYLTF